MPAPEELTSPSSPTETSAFRENIPPLYSNHVSIVPLNYQDTPLVESAGQPAWESEPWPDLPKVTAPIMHRGMYETAFRADKKRLLEIMQHASKKISSASGQDLDLRNLTPYQAMQIITETLKEKMQYEYLLAPLSTQDEQDLLSGKLPTAFPELMTIMNSNPDRFFAEIDHIKHQLDNYPADKLLDRGIGLCRHLTAAAVVMYSALKDHQEGLLLNGSRLIYHDEGVGREVNHQLTGDHAYGLLITSYPSESGSPYPHITAAVYDPEFVTYGLEPDRTYNRLSQIPSFIEEFGNHLGLLHPQLESLQLANRIVDYYEKAFAYRISHKGAVPPDLLHDYTAALTCNPEYDQQILARLYQTLFPSGTDRVDFLNTAYQIPALTKPYQGMQIMMKKYLPQLNEQVKKIDFRDVLLHENKQVLFACLSQQLEIVVNYKHSLDIDDEKNLVAWGYVEFASRYIQACLEGYFRPDPPAVKLLQHLIKLDRKYQTNSISREQIEKFEELAS
jgi:hypothetical protein